MKKLFLSTLLLALPLLASAYDIAVENSDGVTIYYNYHNNGTELEVTNGGKYSGVVNIPEEVTYMSRTRKVTSIGERAFYHCSGLTSVTIPNSVNSIGGAAFSDCSSLTSVTIGNSVTSIGGAAFSGCSSLTSVTIGNSVTTIGNWAFNECTNLTSVIIPNSVTSIGGWAFCDCSGLISVTIGNSVTTIENSAFGNCYRLTSVIIPNSVTTIGNYAFSGCSGLTSVTIGNSVTSIGNSAFSDCSGLTSVSIPNSVTSIGGAAFSWCSGLSSLTIGNSVTTIGGSAFLYCKGLTSVTIPNSVTTIGGSAFQGCSLTSVIIPNSVTSIGQGAFYGCSDLTSVTIGNSVTSIGDKVFFKCNSLTSVIAKMENPYSFVESCFPDEVYSNATLYVPKGTKDKYKSTDYWSKFSFVEEGEPIEYSLTYIVDGITYITYTLKRGDLITPEENPTKEGYTFSGWSEIPETMPANDVTITGTFTINKYKLTYKVDGNIYKSTNIYYGATITPEKDPTKEGYTFSGWSEIPETMPANNVTITGSFTVNKYKLTYNVDGEEYKTAEVDYGTAITPEEAPVKEGYTFSGWSEIPETMPAGDVTITGSFTINKYKLTYMVDGVEYKSYEVEFGASITPEASPANEGQTFSGWSEIPATMPANDVVITGTFSDNSYKLTYMVDGEVFKSSHVEYGSTITPETPPTKEGYTFSGWSEIPTTMPASDVTISGIFTPNKYKLTYTVDGEEYKTTEVDCGAAITPEDNPTKEGYTFSGWSEIPENMPAGDVTITGTFTINTYTITYMVDNAVLMTEEVAYGSTIAPPKSQKDGYDILWSFYPTTMPAYSITINGTYTTGISSLNVEEKDRQVFTSDGKRVETPKKGLNIIRMSDGTVKKVVVK